MKLVRILHAAKANQYFCRVVIIQLSDFFFWGWGFEISLTLNVFFAFKRWIILSSVSCENSCLSSNFSYFQ